MIIRWLGHASFSIRASSGATVRMDPFEAKLGLPVSDEPADVVTVSHGHWDHNAAHLVPGKPVVLDAPGEREAAGIMFTGVEAFHDDAQGVKRGKNILFRFEADGVAVCHCGDLGHVLTPEQVKALGRVDVLLVPVGGTYTLDAKQADQVAALLKAKIAIPMHYKMPGSVVNIADEKPFLENKPRVRRLDRLEVTGETLPAALEVVVLAGPR